jgi:pyruvoyl-dependent arginine decarboxylase (PvlArgDC)
MALLARQTGSVVHVVLAREPGAVEHARAVAKAVGVDISIDLMAFSIRARFGGRAA